MPILIKIAMPKWTGIAACLMVSFAVSTFEDMKTWLFFFSGWLIEFLILLAIPCLLSVMFSKMCSIALCTSGYVKVTTKYQVPPFSTVLALWNTKVYVCAMNGGDVLSNIEVLVYDVFCNWSTLWVLDIDPNYCHIRLGWSFDDIWFWSQYNIVEDIWLLEDAFNNVWRDGVMLQ